MPAGNKCLEPGEGAMTSLGVRITERDKYALEQLAQRKGLRPTTYARQVLKAHIKEATTNG